jgi:hypothetical protein
MKASTSLALRDWLDSIAFGAVFMAGMLFLRGKAAADLDNALPRRLVSRSKARKESLIRKEIKKQCGNDDKREEALVKLWRSFHQHHSSR